MTTLPISEDSKKSALDAIPPLRKQVLVLYGTNAAIQRVKSGWNGIDSQGNERNLLAAQSPCTVAGHADRPSCLESTRNVQYAPHCGEVEKYFFARSIGRNVTDAENLVRIGEMERICHIIVLAQNIAEPDAASKGCNGSI
jgi:hypothetical protein